MLFEKKRHCVKYAHVVARHQSAVIIYPMEDNTNLEAFKRYASRINRVIDYVYANYGESFTLEELASVADFSKYHFCRIFQSFTGESLFVFISRIRLEKSADKLVSDKSKSITDIANDSGYSSPAVFSKAFKDKFRVSPSQWRSNPGKQKSNSCKQDGNGIKAEPIEFTYIEYGIANKWRFKMNEIETTVKIEKWPEATVAYVRHVGEYRVTQTFSKICGTDFVPGLVREVCLEDLMQNSSLSTTTLQKSQITASYERASA